MKKLHLLLIALSIFMTACNNEPKQPTAEELKAKEDSTLLAQSQGLFKQLSGEATNPNNAITAAKVKLGKILYFDNRLSKDQTQSCNTCHNLSTYGVDNLPVSKGDNGGNGTRNSPTTLNAAFHVAQFWDGRMADVEEQAGGPVLNPVEMAIPNEKFLIDRLSKVEMYKKMFAEAFPDQKKPITYENIRFAIAAFERTLTTPSKFDDYLGGNVEALSDVEKKGLSDFISTGCTACHSGSLLGGTMFQKFGLFGSYWDLTKSANIDEGKATLTKNEADKFVFLAPALRNVEKTAPYFHDGSVSSLAEATKIMAKLQLNKDLTDAEVADMVAFMNTLTGELPADVIAKPVELADQK